MSDLGTFLVGFTNVERDAICTRGVDFTVRNRVRQTGASALSLSVTDNHQLSIDV